MKLTLLCLFMFFAPSLFAQKPTHPNNPIICDPESTDTIIRNGVIIYLHPDENAQFPGGNVELKKFLAEKMELFPCSPEFQSSAKCYLRFTVLASGKIEDIIVVRGVPDCPECDKEAKRVAQNMPDWIPAKKDGAAVASKFNLPIRFCF